MKRGLLGILLLSTPAPAHAHPKQVRKLGPQATEQKVERAARKSDMGGRSSPPPFDPKLRNDSKLIVPHGHGTDDWHHPPWMKPDPERAVAPNKRKIQILPATMSGGRGVKIKIPI